MPVTITINGEDAGHALRELHGLAGGMSSAIVSGQPATKHILTATEAGQIGAVLGADPKTETTKPLTAAQKKKAAAEAALNAGAEDSADTEKQDAADEAADTKDEDETLTHDSVRDALGEYVKAFGMAAAQEDGPKVIKLAMDALKLKKPGDAKAAWKVSEIPDTQEALARVRTGVLEMLRKNPFDRKPAV